MLTPTPFAAIARTTGGPLPRTAPAGLSFDETGYLLKGQSTGRTFREKIHDNQGRSVLQPLRLNLWFDVWSDMTVPDDRFRLDELYQMVATIYYDKIVSRTATATFSHFVETCGMLTIHDRRKMREGLDVNDALCKALGWYFPLLAKMRVKSAEELIFRKFPRVCPYCRKSPHKEAECKLVRGTSRTVDHKAVEEQFAANWESRPADLDGWADMFQDIYPRDLEERGRSSIGLLEELGELAEAVRVFESHPQYFLGEAADTFSYIMGIANEHKMKCLGEGKDFSLESEFLKRYPGLCPQCGSTKCQCPSVPEATIGRMAKEMPIVKGTQPFFEDATAFTSQGAEIGSKVLGQLGGYAGLAAQIPFDRGDANRALVSLCIRIGDAVSLSQPELAATLRAEAFKIANAIRLPGTKADDSSHTSEILSQVRAAWNDLDEDLQKDIRSSTGAIGPFGSLLDNIRVLFVLCSPNDEEALRVNAEMRAIKDAVQRKIADQGIRIEILPAATPDDLRRELLRNTYDIVHFSGHANEIELVLENEDGSSAPVALTDISTALKRHPSIKCVILNGCETGKALKNSIVDFTIAMDENLNDDAAIEFSRGFYDGLVHGKSIEHAFEEGTTAVKFAGLDADYIKLLTAIKA